MTHLGFNKDSEAFTVFEQLRQEGIKKREFDRGYYQIDYSQPGPNQTLVGQGDGVIDEVEVYQTALDLYEAEPENARYRRIVEGFAGDPIPWELNDYNSKTNFDEKIRKKVTSAIEKLDQLLISKGYQKGSDDYNEKMAVGLFYFVYSPDNPAIIQIHGQQFLKEVWELWDIELEEFMSYLQSNGGLGTALIEEDSPIEATALEALQTKKGWCTEQSKILYAVYRMAGLKPFFVYTRVEEVEKVTGERVLQEFRGSGHVYVGIPLTKQSIFFDLANNISHVRYKNYYSFNGCSPLS